MRNVVTDRQARAIARAFWDEPSELAQMLSDWLSLIWRALVACHQLFYNHSLETRKWFLNVASNKARALVFSSAIVC